MRRSLGLSLALIGATLLFATAIATRAQAAIEDQIRAKISTPTKIAAIAGPRVDGWRRNETERKVERNCFAGKDVTSALQRALPIEKTPLTLLDMEMIPQPPVKFTADKYRARRV